jgi:hypothetical protein
MKTGPFALAAALLVMVSGCQSTATTTSPTTTVTTTATTIYSGTLSMGGTQFQAFDVLQALGVTVTLTGLRMSGTSTTVSTPVKLSIGSPASDLSSCVGTSSLTVTPGFTSQISQQLIGGGYCFSLSDLGGLTGDVDFTVRLTQSAAGAVNLGAAGTETFSSNIYPLGSDTRTFAASQSGSVVATLQSVSPAAALGFGVVVPAADNTCMLTTSFTVAAGSNQQFSAQADPGTYCVKVYDAGGLQTRVLFQVQITHQ